MANQRFIEDRILAVSLEVEALLGLKAARLVFRSLTRDPGCLTMTTLANEWGLLPVAAPWAMAGLSGRPFRDCVLEFNAARPRVRRAPLVDESFQLDSAVRERMMMNLCLELGPEIAAAKIAEALDYHKRCLQDIADGRIHASWEQWIQASYDWLKGKEKMR